MNYIITAIDTDAGKSVVTGLLAKYLLDKGKDVITMKMAQTGCETVSEDIETHRRIMGIPMQTVDEDGLTCPYLFKFPASPHLSARMEGVEIDEGKITDAFSYLKSKYRNVLLEGVGGLMVPLNPHKMLIDYIKELDTPVILVTSGRLGSINHTLLSLEALKARGVNVYGIIYNHYPVTDTKITAESAEVIKQYMRSHYPNALWGEVPLLKNNETELNLPGWFDID